MTILENNCLTPVNVYSTVYDMENDGADETEVTYCRILHPGRPGWLSYCSAVHIHGQDCEGGYEVPQSDYAWLTPGPWRRMEVQP